MSATLLGILPANPTPAKSNQAAKLSYHAPTQRIAYAQGRTVVLRSLAASSPAPTEAPAGPRFLQPGTQLYAQHAHPVTVARFSPSGYYCASADMSGLVRIWDVLNLTSGAGGEAVLKLEHRALAGPVRDIAWDAEGKRLIAVGEGRDSFGAVFLLDSGSSAGTIEGHSKPINAVALNTARPFRAITAADDAQLAWYTGAPYKLARTLADAHTRFVHTVAFSPSGMYALSAGSDSRLVLLDGKSGDILASDLSGASGGAHMGTVYAVAFHPSSDETFISAGADSTLKVWRLSGASASLQSSLSLKIPGAERGDDQLVAACFAGPDRVVVQSGNGQLTLVHLSSSSPSNSNTSSSGNHRIEAIYAPTKSITALHAGGSMLYGASFDGKVVAWDLSHGVDNLLQGGSVSCTPLVGAISGAALAPAVMGLALSCSAMGHGELLSVGLDDALKRIPLASAAGTGTAHGSAVALSGQPKALAAPTATPNGPAYIATPDGFDVVDVSSSRKVHSQPAPSAPSAIAVHPHGTLVALGCEDGKVRMYAASPSGAGIAVKELPHATLANGRSAITALAFDPSGSLLAAGESNGKIIVYDVSAVSGSGTAQATVKILHWVFHTARINDIKWSPDGDAAVSGSLDTNVYIWSVSKPAKNIAIKNAHAGGVNAVAWLDDARIATAGADACARIYSVKRHP
ncbi:WD40 repeat-like protein [Tilletiaria anomala UBC 951]|uniref:WD40 repeat-like protein n=1 Tax=Tilletiaria anomala (strain ATCC 24038 / CBS 436.72 / UBC 951) TaxID=1037660 RepID=A0A066VAM4_TILAU|nr:WD40 repeat-like protein [Tilletiaria anomala UBC 951]KDN38792.1 WD40 repeat-like protein [Tilletiaria anomala UBC 951]